MADLFADAHGYSVKVIRSRLHRTREQAFLEARDCLLAVGARHAAPWSLQHMLAEAFVVGEGALSIVVVCVPPPPPPAPTICFATLLKSFVDPLPSNL
jgi:hypothetical protein